MDERKDRAAAIFSRTTEAEAWLVCRRAKLLRFMRAIGDAALLKGADLNLAIAAIVYWNSTYIADAVAHLRTNELPANPRAILAICVECIDNLYAFSKMVECPPRTCFRPAGSVR